MSKVTLTLTRRQAENLWVALSFVSVDRGFTAQFRREWSHLYKKIKKATPPADAGDGRGRNG